MGLKNTIWVALLVFGVMAGHGTAKEDGPEKAMVFAQYGFYFTEGIPEGFLDLVKKAARTNELALIDGKGFKGGAKAASLIYDILPLKEYPPIAKESLPYMGFKVTPELLDLAEKTDKTMILTSVLPRKGLFAKHRRVEHMLHSLAEESKALIWDHEVRLLFTANSWQGYRLAGWQDDLPDMRRQVHMHAYRDGQLIRIITLGMKKLALPDLVIENVPSGHTKTGGGLINSLGQALIEGNRPRKGVLALDLSKMRHNNFREEMVASRLRGHQPSVPVHLKLTKPKDGDPENLLLSIDVKANSEQEVQVKQLALFEKVFGGEGEVVGVKTGDATLKAASALARTRLMKLKDRFKKGPPLNERLIVKGPFRHGKKTEWMWVELIGWQGNAITGVLLNTPRDLPNYKLGARVTVKVSEAFDYLWSKADGSTEGNETTKIIQRRYR